MDKEHNILVYTAQYEALLAAGAIEDGSGSYYKFTAEDRFRVWCLQEVWSRIRFAETDRRLHFAKAIRATADDHLSLDDPIMAREFEDFKKHKYGYRSSRRLAGDRRDYLGHPCNVCGEPSISWQPRCSKHRYIRKRDVDRAAKRAII